MAEQLEIITMSTEPSTQFHLALWLRGAAVAALVLLPNCDATHQLQVVSAAQTGCAPDDIEITDDEPGFNSRSWVAWCNSERFQCFGAGNTANCTTFRKPAADPAAKAGSMSPRHSGATWVTHQVPDCGVKADFPGSPKDEVSDLQTKAGLVKLSSAMFVLAEGKGETSVSCTPALSKKVTVSAVLDGARDGMLKNIGASLLEEHEIIGGREVLFDLEGEQGVARLLWLNNRVIVATAMPLSAIGPKSAKRFVSSVQLTEEH
jgi:hypothetical protein